MKQQTMCQTIMKFSMHAMLAIPVANAAVLRSATDAQHLPTQFLAPSALPGENDLLRDILAPCSERPGSHICDPEHLLSGGAFGAQSEALRRLAEVKKVSQCPGMGYEVYVVVLSVPPEEAHAAAAQLGRKWGVLGGSEACGAVAVYAARERVLSVASDRALENTLLSPKVQRSLEHSPFDSAEPSSADSVVAQLVSQLSGALDGSADSKHYVLVQQGAAIVLYGISSVIGLVATGLLVFCIYDIMAHWFHAMRFHKCQNKVRRVHEAFLKAGELSLCPYCVAPVSNQPCSSHVVFLCGHRFHMDCANRWFAEEPQNSGRCAICAGSSIAPKTKSASLASPQAALADEIEGTLECAPCLTKESKEVITDCANADDDDDDEAGNGSSDEAKNFMLYRLHEEYPDIIPQACVDRWTSCHTEIWLQELRCPRYKSIFAKHSHK